MGHKCVSLLTFMPGAIKQFGTYYSCLVTVCESLLSNAAGGGLCNACSELVVFGTVRFAMTNVISISQTL